MSTITHFFKIKNSPSEEPENYSKEKGMEHHSPINVLETVSPDSSVVTIRETGITIQGNTGIAIEGESVNEGNNESMFIEDPLPDVENNEEIDTEFRKWAESENTGKEPTVEHNQNNMQLLVNKAVTFVEEMEKQTNNEPKSQRCTLKQPKSLKGGKLFPHQLQAIDWMRRLFENGSHGLLGDEMGLGKTIEVIGLLAYLREAGVWGDVLIIAPLSTLGNWMKEFASWLPSVSVLKYHGNREERKALRASILRQREEHADPWMRNVLVTSYEMIRFDAAFFQKTEWFYIIVDEGHRLKNNECQLMQCLFSFAHSVNTSRLILTGTPLQNNLKELWSLMNFLLPDIFSSAKDFLKWFDFNQSSSESIKSEIVNTLRKVISPFFLRRTKSDIDVSLPVKREMVVYCEMTPIEREIYDIVVSDDGRYETLLASRNLHLHSTTRNFRIQILRQLVSHPFNVYEEKNLHDGYSNDEKMVQASSKLSVLDAMLQVLLPQQHRVIVFVQFVETLHLLEDYCALRHFPYCSMEGSMPQEQREQSIRRFTEDATVPLFLSTTRSGGLGINLSCADTVFLYDSDWNPQMDIQAMDRSHRLGQTRNVAIYRLITLQTIDMQLLRVSEEKRKLERIVTHHERKAIRLKMLTFDEYLELSKVNAFAGREGTRSITVLESKELAAAHATKEIAKMTEFYEIVNGSSEETLFGGINQDGQIVQKRTNSKRVLSPKRKGVTKKKRLTE